MLCVDGPGDDVVKSSPCRSEEAERPLVSGGDGVASFKHTPSAWDFFITVPFVHSVQQCINYRLRLSAVRSSRMYNLLVLYPMLSAALSRTSSTYARNACCNFRSSLLSSSTSNYQELLNGQGVIHAFEFIFLERQIRRPQTYSSWSVFTL
jgi:hypothetical protein